MNLLKVDQCVLSRYGLRAGLQENEEVAGLPNQDFGIQASEMGK
jgi:hypothetical protein